MKETRAPACAPTLVAQKLQRFVQGEGDKMDYAVVADTSGNAQQGERRAGHTHARARTRRTQSPRDGDAGTMAAARCPCVSVRQGAGRSRPSRLPVALIYAAARADPPPRCCAQSCT